MRLQMWNKKEKLEKEEEREESGVERKKGALILMELSPRYLVLGEVGVGCDVRTKEIVGKWPIWLQGGGRSYSQGWSYVECG
jgi:Fe-S cluster assembly ATPase SufC